MATWVTAGATIALFIAAGVAAWVGWKNLKILREQLKQNTFLVLLEELADEKGRKSRSLIFENFSSPDTANNNKQRVRKDQETKLKDAIEEVISGLDRIGFFLLRGDPKLKEDAPEWIWEIAGQMWHRLNWYVEYRRQTSKKYAIYFEELANDARAQEYIEKPTVQQESDNHEH